MNYLVFLDTHAGELEKILSGVKSMVLKEFDPVHPPAHPVEPGDSLYFLREDHDYSLRVQATVVRVLPLTGSAEGDLSHALKEQQPRLQLTEAQYNAWSAKTQALLVEFDGAHKIEMIQVAAPKISGRTGWIAFEQFSLITEQYQR